MLLKRIMIISLLIPIISCISIKKEMENPFRITGEELTKYLKVKQFVPITFINNSVEFKTNSIYLVEEVNATVKDIGVYVENNVMEENLTSVLKGEATCETIFDLLFMMNKLDKKINIRLYTQDKECNTFFEVDDKKVPVYIWMKRETDDFYIWYIVEEELLVKKK